MSKNGQVKNESNSGIVIPGGTIFTDNLLRLYNQDILNKIYREAATKDPVSLIDSLLDIIGVNIDISKQDIEKIPEKGPLIVVSNHPYRGIDSMILYKILYKKRPDIKILGNHLLKEIEPLKNIIIPVNTHENERYFKSSFSGIRMGLNFLRDGHCLCIFPAAEDSKYFELPGMIIDSNWNPVAIKFIHNAGVPVLPVYFHGTLTGIKYLLRKINPLTVRPALPAELTRKSNRTISVRIGSPVSLKEQTEIRDHVIFGRYLRASVFSLSTTVREKRKTKKKILRKRNEPVVEKCPPEILKEEYIRIKNDYELFRTKNYSVVCTPAYIIPNIFREIGRLREVTFREVGEGTGKSIDIDKYDFYYQHLFIWDTEEERLVGAYRLGKGKEIVDRYGIKGFYISSLFRIKKSFTPVLSMSIELGRSFVIKEYQKKAMPLFLLWKGIMIFLLKNPEYRYLIGPVSISDDLSKFSKSLLVEFIMKWFFNHEFSVFVKPRKEFIPEPDKINSRKIFIDTCEKDINKIEKIITSVESGYRMPVLLKKYIEINSKIIGFNIDPKFNNCLDGLMILDLYEVPEEIIWGFAKEINIPSVFERFRVKNKETNSESY